MLGIRIGGYGSSYEGLPATQPEEESLTPEDLESKESGETRTKHLEVSTDSPVSAGSGKRKTRSFTLNPEDYCNDSSQPHCSSSTDDPPLLQAQSSPQRIFRRTFSECKAPRLIAICPRPRGGPQTLFQGAFPSSTEEQVDASAVITHDFLSMKGKVIVKVVEGQGSSSDSSTVVQESPEKKCSLQRQRRLRNDEIRTLLKK
ncbi:MAG: hypothetical protein ACHQUC_06070 [Chlamydiales bacterium]